MPALARLFDPRGIAIVGASADPTRTGGQTVRALVEYGYTGHILPVNPKHAEIGGRRSYARVRDIGEPCDLAVVALPAAQVPAVIAECGEHGVGYAVVLGGGFRETGTEGAHLEAQMLAAARRHGVRIIGPNCLGLVNVHARVFAAFGSIARAPELLPGPVSAVIQSGGLGNSLVIRCALAGCGFRYVVSTGNESDIGMVELIDAYVDDQETRVILAYLEGVNDGRALMRVLRRACAAGKPVIVLKGGNTDAGRAAAASHTANLTGSYDIYRAALRQCGAIEVKDLDEAADYALCLLSGRLPAGRAVAAMGASGGSAAVFSDAAVEHGLTLSGLSPATTAVLRASLPPIASVTNPVDYTSGYPRPDTREEFQRAFDAVLADPGVDQLALLFATPNRRQLQIASELLTTAAARSEKPMIVFSVIPPEITPEGVATLRKAGIPVLTSPLRIARSMATLADFADARRRSLAPALPREISGIVLPARCDKPVVLDEHESKALLAQAGIPVTRDMLLGLDPDRADIEGVAFPVAVKIVSRDIAHKSDIGGVRLGVADETQLRAAMADVIARVRASRPDAKLGGVLVCEMVSDAVEVIVGVVNDAAFGPVVAIGMGGVLAETLDDVAYRIAPCTPEEATQMVAELRGCRIFDGVRGKSPRDIAALAATIVQVSELAWQLRDRLVELDINPLLVRAAGEGVVAGDALVVVK